MIALSTGRCRFVPNVKIAVTGASGFVGRALCTHLEHLEHTVLRLTRFPTGARNEVHWDPVAGDLNLRDVAGAHAFVNLAGESIADGRWSADKKRRIRISRVHGTGALSELLGEMSTPPKVLVSASAIGFYGNRGSLELDERSASGDGFLAGVCREWEAATEPAAAKGIRVVHARLGMILGANGGALQKMLPFFSLGLGGVMGPGDQVMSWIALDDVTRAILHVLTHDGIRGAVNLVSPNPVTNREFTTVLAQAIEKPTFLPMPSFAARIIMGEMAKEMLLASVRVVPRILDETHYEFHFPQLEQALAAALGS